MSLKNGQKGFILAEFMIALPLLILLLYGLANMTMKIISLAREQMANYVAETEAHEVLRRITDDARTAIKVERRHYTNEPDLQEIVFTYSTAETMGGYGYGGDTSEVALAFTDVIGTRRYLVDNGYLYSKRNPNQDIYTNPVTGKNFFGDTSVTKLKYSLPSKNVLHVTVEILEKNTGRTVKLSTSVFMSACKEMIDL